MGSEGQQNLGDTPVPGSGEPEVGGGDVKEQSEQNRGPLETAPGSHGQQEQQEQHEQQEKHDTGIKMFGEEQQPTRSGEEGGDTRQEPVLQETQEAREHIQENQEEVTDNQSCGLSQEVVPAVNQDQEESHHQEQQQQDPEQEQDDFDMDLGDLEPSFA